MNFMDLMPILFPGTFVAFLVIERLRPARKQPHVPWWLAKGVAFFAAGIVLNAGVPALILEAIGERSVLHLQNLGTFGGAALFLLVTDFVAYWIHRGLHNSEPIWRWTHQLH